MRWGAGRIGGGVGGGALEGVLVVLLVGVFMLGALIRWLRRTRAVAKPGIVNLWRTR